jgi:hypothetical protein
MMFRIVFWDVLPCKMIVDNHFTLQYIPEDNSEHFTSSLYMLVGNHFLSRVSNPYGIIFIAVFLLFNTFPSFCGI